MIYDWNWQRCGLSPLQKQCATNAYIHATSGVFYTSMLCQMKNIWHVVQARHELQLLEIRSKYTTSLSALVEKIASVTLLSFQIYHVCCGGLTPHLTMDSIPCEHMILC